MLTDYIYAKYISLYNDKLYIIHTHTYMCDI